MILKLKLWLLVQIGRSLVGAHNLTFFVHDVPGVSVPKGFKLTGNAYEYGFEGNGGPIIYLFHNYV